MPSLPTKIKSEVHDILQRKGKEFITAYQILEWLPKDLRDQLIYKRSGVGGAGSDRYYTAITDVTKAAGMLVKERKVRQDWLDTRNLSVKCRNKPIRPGNQYCALYRGRSKNQCCD